MARGQAEIDETFEAEDLEAWEERRLEPEECIDAGDVVVVSGGRVVRIQGYLDRDAGLEAAGLSG